MKEITTRTLSGVVFVALIVGAIVSCPYAFALLFCIICGGAVYEFHRLTNKTYHLQVNPITSVLAGVLLFLSAYIEHQESIQFKLYPIYGLFISFTIVYELFRTKDNPIQNWAFFILGQVIVALPFSILNHILFIDGWNPMLLLSIFITIWIYDSGAYIFGISFGKHRMIERISPKKSWEGFVGGLVVALVSGYIFSLTIPNIGLIHWFVISALIVIAGTFGDLSESFLKRNLQVKDSGNIMPGHGGFLDRFDSLLLAAPVIFVYLQLFVY